jgi:hypothetical protein
MSFTPHDESKIRAAFSLFDTNLSGALDLEEFRAVLAAKAEGGGNPLTEDEIIQLFSEVDRNGNNLIEVDELVTWWRSSSNDIRVGVQGNSSTRDEQRGALADKDHAIDDLQAENARLTEQLAEKDRQLGAKKDQLKSSLSKVYAEAAGMGDEDTSDLDASGDGGTNSFVFGVHAAHAAPPVAALAFGDSGAPSFDEEGSPPVAAFSHPDVVVGVKELSSVSALSQEDLLKRPKEDSSLEAGLVQATGCLRTFLSEVSASSQPAQALSDAAVDQLNVLEGLVRDVLSVHTDAVGKDYSAYDDAMPPILAAWTPFMKEDTTKAIAKDLERLEKPSHVPAGPTPQQKHAFQQKMKEAQDALSKVVSSKVDEPSIIEVCDRTIMAVRTINARRQPVLLHVNVTTLS